MNALKITLALLVSLLVYPLWSQEEISFQRTSALDQSLVIPSSPQASSLGQFGESEISPYNGKAQIQIPVHTITGKTISVPINLIHDGTNPKVDVREGWSGISWNTTSNYSIVRNVVAAPDLEYNFFSMKDSLDSTIGIDQFFENRLLRRISTGQIENQLDHYYLSYPNGSVKFYITPDKEIIQKEHNNLTITPTYDFEGDITRFHVMDDKGITYEFYATEETKINIDDHFEGTLAPYYQLHQYYSAWHLTRIIGTNGIEEFLFDYETASIAHGLDINPYNSRSVTYNPQGINSCCGAQNVVNSSVGSTNTMQVLDRKFLENIKYVLGGDTLETLVFESTQATCPHSAPTDKKLDRIRCLKGKDGLANIIDYEFGYDCSTGRLTLKSMQEKSVDGMTVKEPYQFSYYAGALPEFISTSIDHFGFFNNKANGNNLIPQIKLENSSVALNSGAANRSPDETASKRATIDTIFYPTGGFTKYHWEMNEVAGRGAYLNYAPTLNQADDREAGGLRVQSIENYGSDGKLLTKRSFRYVKSGTNTLNQESSGLMLNEPIYTESTIYNNCPVMQIGGGTGDPCNMMYDCARITISASSRSVLGAIKGSHIGYSRVEQIIEANDNSGETSGKVVYFFLNQPLSPFAAKDDVENGLLIRKEIYDADDKLLDKDIYVWSTQEGESRRNIEYASFRVVPETTQDNKPTLCLNAAGQYSWRVLLDDADCVNQHDFDTKFRRITVNHSQRWVYQSEKISTRYFFDVGGNPAGSLTTTTDYVYGDTTTNQPTEVTVLNSDGKTYKTTTHFRNSYNPSEYPVADDSGSFLGLLKAKNMTSFPLVQAQYIDNQLVYQTKLNYKGFGTRVFPYKLYESFPTKANHLAEVFDNYDAVGNVSQGHRHYEHTSGESQPIAMIYSHGNSRMAAQIRNAKFGEVAYTGFETNNKNYQGGWGVPDADLHIKFTGDARTGAGHYQPSSTVVAGKVADAGEYIISYYTKTPNTISIGGTGVTILRTKQSSDHPESWQFVRHKIKVASRNNVTVTINGGTLLDELRFYPADALMTSYAYDKDSRLPIGVIDENALPTRFDYDDLLRSVGVRNFDDYYLSFTEYRYKNDQNAQNSITNFAFLVDGFVATNNFQNSFQSVSPNFFIKTINYFDGLGRDIQTSSVGTSAARNDQLGFINYDKFGRVTKRYMPYSVTSNNGAFRANAQTEQETFYEGQFTGEGTHALVETELEFSPLNRVFKQRAQGADFQSHPAETKYGVNLANEVRNFHSANLWYPAESLYKTTQSDENGNLVILYTDRIGRKIMQDQEGSKTYFLYNVNGLLEQVIQPEAAQKGHDTPMLDNTNSIIRNGSFLYTYDAEHRMKTKKIPNCNAYQYFYDDLDQLVMTIDGKGFKTFIKRDKLGRQVVTGRYTGAAIPTTNEVVFEERSSSAPHYYTTNQSFPADGIIDVYTVTYYDDYDLNDDDTEEISYQTTTGYDATDYNFVRGKATASKVAILEPNGATPTQFLNNYFFFDQFQRVLQIRKNNHLGGSDSFWHKYNFAGWLLNARRAHSTTINGNTQNININERYDYDHVGRELAYYHQIEGQAEKQVCEKSYNEREELVQKSIGKTSGGSFLQTIDLSYNIRRWLVSMNNPDNLGSDLFGMRMTYTNPFILNDNYNGNVSNIAWRNKGDGSTKNYEFTYDKLNRLTNAVYKQAAPSTNSLTNLNDRYNAEYSYDLNGNISTLKRNGVLPNNTVGEMDNLNYDYAADGSLNRIIENSSTDAGFKSATTENGLIYQYDGNGNTTYDDHKGMTITYNFLNQPESISKKDAGGSEIGSFQWRHDALGNKLSKTVSTNQLSLSLNPIVSKEYLATQTIESDGTVANGSDVTFTAGQTITLKAGFTAAPDFLARIMPSNLQETREYVNGVEYVNEKMESVYFSDGRVKYEGNNTEYQYVLKDNQGNTRSLFKEGTGGVAESIEDYSYYPLGALHSQAAELNQKYLQTGKELQSELDLGWSDFKARCFDNWSGKWQGVDILADYNANSSPYTFASANPIRFSDPSGMISEDEDGLMQVSTDLWGSGRNQDFMNQSAGNAAQRAETTQNRQAGYIDTGSGSGKGSTIVPDWLKNQLQKDLTTYKVEFNEHGGNEVDRKLVDNGVDISFEGKLTTVALRPNQNMLAKRVGMATKFYNMKNAAYTKLAYDAYSIGKFSATMGKFGKIVGNVGLLATAGDYYFYLDNGGNFGTNPRTALLVGDVILNRVGVNTPHGFLMNLGWEAGKAAGRYKNHLERKWYKPPGGEDGLLTTDF